MSTLDQAIELAITMGGSITRNSVGFVTCFAKLATAVDYAAAVNSRWEDLTAQESGKCVVVVTVESLM